MAGEDYKDFFMNASLPDSALEAITVALRTSVPRNWRCEHGQTHLSGFVIDGAQ